MKRFLLTVALTALMALPAHANNFFNVPCSTGSTTCTAVTSNANGMHINQVLVSLSSADNLTFNCGSVVVMGPIYFAANSGLVEAFLTERGHALICPGNTDFTVTKGTAATPLTVFSNVDQ